MSKAWKDTERRIAKRLNGDRIPVSDKRSDSDVLAPYLTVEVKHRKQIPNWIAHAIAQATAAATDDRLPIAILHESGKRGDNDTVFMSMTTFEMMYNTYQDIEYLRTMQPDEYERLFCPHQFGAE